MLNNPGWIRRREYQAFATLTICRAWYALKYGATVSKPVAARWAQQNLADRWTELIAQAAAGPQESQAASLSETLEFIRYTVEHAEQNEDGEFQDRL